MMNMMGMNPIMNMMNSGNMGMMNPMMGMNPIMNMMNSGNKYFYKNYY